ncbi:MAG: phosphatidylglycerophosphatase A [Pseudomonadota bacterium]
MTRIITSFFGSGFLPIAPGSWGSLAAIPFAIVIYALGGFLALVAATIVVFAVGLWAVQQRTAGMADPDLSEIVIDEVVGQGIALFSLAGGLWWLRSEVIWLPWPGLIFGFVFFRLFDILKPYPCNKLDQLKTPLGVMADDVVAGLYAAIITGVTGAVAHGYVS